MNLENERERLREEISGYEKRVFNRIHSLPKGVEIAAKKSMETQVSALTQSALKGVKNPIPFIQKHPGVVLTAAVALSALGWALSPSSSNTPRGSKKGSNEEGRGSSPIQSKGLISSLVTLLKDETVGYFTAEAKSYLTHLAADYIRKRLVKTVTNASKKKRHQHHAGRRSEDSVTDETVTGA